MEDRLLGDSVIVEAVVFFMISAVDVACAGRWGMDGNFRIQPVPPGWGVGSTWEPECPSGLGEAPVEFILPLRHQ